MALTPRARSRTGSVILLLLLILVAVYAGRRLMNTTADTTAREQPAVGKPYTVEERLAQYGPASRQRWAPRFARAAVPYPPDRLAFLAFKQQRILQVYAAGPAQSWRFIDAFPILGASGSLGPKLREGDRQVPEGLYGIELLNPNSRYRVSLRIAYPGEFDRAMAASEQRDNLGGDIMIHGGNTSAGCLAMGDEVSEDLFVLAADTGIERISVVLSPVDFRTGNLPAAVPPLPPWTPTLYTSLRAALQQFPLP